MRSTHLLLRASAFSLLATVLSISSSAQIKATNRISMAANDQQTTALRGNVHPLIQRAQDRGPVESSMQLQRVVMQFKRSAAQQKALEQLLQEQQDLSSPNYHKWLTPEQFAERFGVTATDRAKVVSWLQVHGLKVVDVARGGDWIAFSGSASQISSTLRTQFHQYSLEGETHFANATAPAIPTAFAGVVSGFQGLNSFRPRPRVHKLNAKLTSSTTGNHFLVPEDFATIYNVKGLYNAGLTGTGQKIVVVGQSDLSLTSIRNFWSMSGLTRNDPQVILVTGSADPGQPAGDITEASLDVEWAGGVAKAATIIYVNSTNAFNSMLFAIDQNLAPVISISYGDCEPNFADTDIATLVAETQKANAQGQTIVGPAGDDAASDCDFSTNPNVVVTTAVFGLQVDVPAALPTVTGVGGTSFNDIANPATFWNSTNTAGGGSAISYIPELTWNDTLAVGNIAGTGGGASKLFSKPFWQTGAGVPADGARDVPDISFNAALTHDGYIICEPGSCTNGFRDSGGFFDAVGGTSAGVPVFAAIVSLINQQTGTSQGNLNPRLYALAGTSPAAFHDITNGDNKVPCQIGSVDCPSGGTIGFLAGPGYDQVTGLGSVDATALVAAWGTPAAGADFSLTPAASTVVAVPHGTNKTVNVTLAPLNGFSGTVTLTCSASSGLGTTQCAVAPGQLTTSGTAVVTITAPATLASAGHDRPASRGWILESTFALMFGGFFALRKKRRLLMAIAPIVLVASVVAWSGCGGGGGSSTGGGRGTGGGNAITGTVTIHATAGNIKHDTSIVVTVN